MRKMYSLICLLFASVLIFAQPILRKPDFKSSPIHLLQEELYTSSKPDMHIFQNKSPKVTGTPIVSDDFSNAANWTISSISNDIKTWVIGTSTDPDAVQLATYTLPLNYWNPDASTSNKFAYFDAIYYLINASVPLSIDVTLTLNQTIDLSQYPGVGIQWNQCYKAYSSDKIFLEYSIDGGNTWSKALGDELYKEMEVNFYAPVFKFMNLSNEIGGHNNVKIRFRWECYYTGANPNNYGAGYGWMIDNLLIQGLNDNDLLLEKIYPIFQGIGFYSKFPYRQNMKLNSVSTMVLNNGGTTQSDIFTYADIFQNSNPVALASILSSEPYVSLNIGQRDTMKTDTFSFIPPIGLNSYIIKCREEQSQTESQLYDNTDTVMFSINDTVFARDRYYTGKFGPTRITGAADGDYSAVGYYFTNQDTISSISVFIAADTKVGAIIRGVLSVYQSGNTFSEQISTNDYTIKTTDITKWVTLSFTPQYNGLAEILQPKTIYYAGIKYFWQTIAPASKGIYIGTDKDAHMTADGFASGSNYFIKANGTGVGHLMEMPRIRLNVKYPDGITNYKNTSITSNASVYPNPSNGVFYLKNGSKIDAISIYNIFGKHITTFVKPSDKIDISGLPQGTYLAQIKCGATTINQKLIIIH